MVTISDRKQLFEDVVRRKRKPVRIPLYSSAYTWKIVDSGYKLTEALYNYDKMYEVQCNFHKKYEYDAYHDLGGRNNLKVLDALGRKIYHINDEAGSINYIDANFMNDDDYDIILKKGFMTYLKENYLPQKYISKTKHNFFNKFYNAMYESKKFTEALQRITEKFFYDYQALWRSSSSFYIPIEYFFCSMRGVRHLSKDIVETPEKLSSVMNLIWEESIFFKNRNIKKGFNNTYNINEENVKFYAFDYHCSMGAHNILSKKQFEKFYWPYLKEVLDYIVKQNQTVFIFIEGKILRLAEYFKAIPKGHVAILSEMDNIFELKKQLGDNLTIVGGFPIHLLTYGTKNQCIDYCKKLIDEVAYDGAYIYSENKLLSFPLDANSKNLRIVLDYFRKFNY